MLHGNGHGAWSIAFSTSVSCDIVIISSSGCICNCSTLQPLGLCTCSSFDARSPWDVLHLSETFSFSQTARKVGSVVALSDLGCGLAPASPPMVGHQRRPAGFQHTGCSSLGAQDISRCPRRGLLREGCLGSRQPLGVFVAQVCHYPTLCPRLSGS